MLDISFNPQKVAVNKTSAVNLCLTNTSSLPIYKISLVISFPPKVKLLAGVRRISINHLDPKQCELIPIKIKATEKGVYYVSSRQFSYRNGNGKNFHISDLSIYLESYVPSTEPRQYKKAETHYKSSKSTFYSNSVLYSVLTERFDLEEFKTLCFHLNINFDNLNGNNLSAKSRELISYCRRRKILKNLVESMVNLRPDLAKHFSVSSIKRD